MSVLFSSRLMVRVAGLLGPLAGMVLGSHAGADASPSTHQPEERDAAEGRVKGQAVVTLCEPIVGYGKAAGIPIQVKDANGQILSDVTGLTFVLDDGTNTQDVTSLVNTVDEQNVIGGVPGSPSLRDAYLQMGDKTQPQTTSTPLQFSNPGYFFLDCTPDKDDQSSVFAAGVELKALSGSTVVSKASLAGRSASKLNVTSNGSSNAPLLPAITPASHDGSGPLEMATVYRDYLAKVGVPFRELFATIAIGQLSNSSATGPAPGGGTEFGYCQDDLVSVSGSTWVWTTAGRAFLDELTASGATSWPILNARTTGAAGPVYGGSNPCHLLFHDEVDFFLNLLAAQLLLFDGPLGNVPKAVSDLAPALRAATVLEPLVVPTTTTTTTPSSTSTSTSMLSTSTTGRDVAEEEAESGELPATGSDEGLLRVALAAALAGAALEMARRRVRPTR